MKKIKVFRENLAYLWKRKSLVFVWAKYKIQAEYTETRLGLVWIFLNPLVSAAVYTLAFNSLLGVRPPRGDVPFLPFYLSSLAIWNMFNGNVNKSARLVVVNLNLMTQIRFPREVVVLVDFIVTLVSYFASMAISIIVLAVFGFYPNINYLFLPIILLSISLFTIGLMYFTSTIGVFFKDLPEVMGPLLRLLFFMSGVIFTIKPGSNSLALQLVQLNPLYWFVNQYRDILIYNESPNLYILSALFVLGFVLCVTGYAFFKAKEDTFADYI